MPAAIRLEAVNKTFGRTTAVANLDLEVPAGALYGFIGPNGAGKTTTIRMLMSILFPDSGELEILGHRSALEAKDKIGYLPEERGVYKNMKVGAYLKYIARLKGLPEPSIKARVSKLLERVELPDVAGRNCEELSKGMLQKIQFAAAIINEPDLLILDEPFSGLDPVSMRMLRDQIVVEHERGATILFSTHVMPQAEEICDHVVMMHKGNKVLDDPIAAIRGQYDTSTILIEPLDADADGEPLASILGVRAVRRKAQQIELQLEPGTDIGSVMQDVIGLLPVARLELARPRLEDIFVRLVAGDSGDEADQLIAELSVSGPSAAQAVAEAGA
ncbi:MAG: ATP-binding cassette domain-containing protein [Gammaproteobacteria bacterium]|nr:ATP-binding cassette domain-containing protein [Gammaproteobacteria bacterium]